METTIELTPIERELKIGLRAAGLTNWQQFKRRYQETLVLAAQIEEAYYKPKPEGPLSLITQRSMNLPPELYLYEDGALETILFERVITPNNGFGLRYIVWYKKGLTGSTAEEYKRRTNQIIKDQDFDAEWIDIYFNQLEYQPYQIKNKILTLELLPKSHVIRVSKQPTKPKSIRNTNQDNQIDRLMQRFHKKPLLNPPELVADIITLLTSKD